MHAWIECLLPNGQWLALDPSVEYLRKQGRTNKLGGFNEIGSDRIVMNTGSHHTVRLGSQTITMDIIQTPTFIATNGDFEYIKNYKILTQ
ncbi:MAG: hypothetical protein ACD_43C00071G0004 [uncultured bacterium]|nr:MAG: hypothetical protein ACD_43C00071G0004 [uncultured bacterium]